MSTVEGAERRDRIWLVLPRLWCPTQPQFPEVTPSGCLRLPQVVEHTSHSLSFTRYYNRRYNFFLDPSCPPLWHQRRGHLAID